MGEKFPLKGASSGSRDPFENFKPLQYFWNALFKFGKWINYSKSNPGEKIPAKRVWSELCDCFLNFKAPSIFVECKKLRSLNLAATIGDRVLQWQHSQTLADAPKRAG